LAAFGFHAAGSFAGRAIQKGATVSLAKTNLGSILVTSNGHTLYLFAKDRHNKSSCSGSCAKYWPPLLAHGKPTAGAGVAVSLLGTTRRSDGAMQVSYHKHPLYTYAPDTKAGQTNGQGSFAFGAKWYAVSANGAAIVKPPATITPPTTSTPTTSPPPYPYP
jgi:predicted lipoprotein with Yx(FWY)xxD motif